MRTLAEHWDRAYAGGDATNSWTEACALPSAEAIRAVAAGLDAPILDVGGGSSRLAGELVAAGYRDVTVLDISSAALELARQQLGERASDVTWLSTDLLAWQPERRYAVWHDRAVLHFFTDPAQRRRYVETLERALRPGGHAVIATFAAEGPERCSGLPVQRSSAEDLLALLGEQFTAVAAGRLTHRTPGGHEQPFTRLTARRDG